MGLAGFSKPSGVLSVVLGSASLQPPSIFPLALCCNDKDKASVTVGCLVTGFIPEPVKVTWDTGSLNNNAVTLPATLHTNSSLYTTVSWVTVSGEWSQQKFTCNVVHSPSNSTDKKTFGACSKNVISPTIKIFHTACDPHNDPQSKMYLLCLITGYTPGEIKVTWLVNGEEDLSLYPATSQPRLEGKLASISSELNITHGQWIPERTYTCKATIHGMSYKSSVRRCTDSKARGIDVYLIPPSPLDLYVNKMPKLTCLVVDLASKESLNIQWSRDRRTPLQDVQTMTKEENNATYTAISTLSVNIKDWVAGETYYCMVSHNDLPEQIQRSITKPTGKRLVPSLHVFLPPEEKNEDRRTLTCLVQNFFPADISVHWLQNMVPVPPNQVYTSEPKPVKGLTSTFFSFSLLDVSKADWEKHTFTCRVIHETLPGNKTLTKSVSKDSELDLQDLCVEEPESKELEELWTSTYIFIILFLFSVSYSATVTLVKVQWVFSTTLRGKPQDVHYYSNIM